MRLSFWKRLACCTVILIAIVTVGGCGGGFQASSSSDSQGGFGTPTPGNKDEELAICSKLSLEGVTWPSTLGLPGKRALALALNISGSFEGSVGWKNITNNFDGQGLSLGLLNQCLGQGSLQPMLGKFRDRYSSSLDVLTSPHRSSLLSMLSKWDASQKSTAVATASPSGIDEDYLPDGRLSLLDELPKGSEDIGHQESATGDSVIWAKQTLYTDGGTTFVPAWKSDLQKLSAHPNFVSIQIEAAMRLHAKSLSYMETLGLHELRSYLMMFDICVQNGGLYQDDIDQFKKAFPSSAGSETTRLKKILDLRVRHVVQKYKNDVLSRKNSIINGKGVVHQTNRDYPKEYCYNSGEKML